MHKFKLIEAELEKTGLDWRVEEGGRHAKFFLQSRFVAIAPKGGATDKGRHLKNVVAQIRRAAKELKCSN